MSDMGREPVRSEEGPTQLGMSGFALAALVLGLLAWIPVLAGLAVLFGLIAMQQIRHREQTGKLMAIIGISLGILGGLRVAVDFWANATAVKDSGRISAQSLPVGQCFDGIARLGTMDDPTKTGEDLMDARPCDGPHDAQVVAVVGLLPDFPGDQEAYEQVNDACTDTVVETVPALRDAQVEPVWIYPLGQTLWRVNPNAACAVTGPGGTKLTGSLLDP